MAEGLDESKARPLYGTSKENCERMIQASLKRNPMVKFVREALLRAGCPTPDSFFKAVHCEEKVGGGYFPGEGVFICGNYLQYQAEVDTILVHELIHAFDQCRAKNVDWANLEHHSCSEIRAANLSGQCYVHKEILILGNEFRLRGGHQRCVRRKAQLSVAMNPNCPSKEAAAAAIEAAWPVCYKDTAPFDRVP